ncbi:MAG: RNA polymerase sigma factor [Patescibacteria group bacterium]|jgi:RNA polymerase sigma-70 factor (ECF subfamily)
MEINREERELLEKIIKKDEKALFFVYKKYQPSIFKFVRSQINNYQLAEELTQDIFIDFIEALRDFRFQSTIKTFLFSIAKHKVVDQIRKKKIKNILFSRIPSFIVESLKVVFIDEEIDKKELEAKISRVIDSLPNDYQIILRLRYIDGVRIKEISERLRMNFKATESLLFRARKNFIKVFKNEI